MVKCEYRQFVSASNNVYSIINSILRESENCRGHAQTHKESETMNARAPSLFASGPAPQRAETAIVAQGFTIS